MRKTFPTLAAARGWRADAAAALSKGVLRAPTRLTLHEASEAWLAGVKAGSIRNRSGDIYKPSVVRGYEAVLRGRILVDLGAARLSEIQLVDVQDLADRLLGEGLDPSTIRNCLMPLRAIYRRALARGEVAVNPTSGLQLPAVRGRRDRIVSPAEAAELIAALPVGDRGLWAAAFYAGPRRGELQALDCESVDLANGVIRISRSWDDKARMFVSPKSAAGTRSIPIPRVLRTHLVGHRLRTGRTEGLLFGATADRPFVPSGVCRRAQAAWEAAGLRPIGLHEARHTCASMMIAAGVNAKAISTYLGHSSVTITYDRYGHLMPGNEAEAAVLLDRYLGDFTSSDAVG